MFCFDKSVISQRVIFISKNQSGIPNSLPFLIRIDIIIVKQASRQKLWVRELEKNKIDSFFKTNIFKVKIIIKIIKKVL